MMNPLHVHNVGTNKAAWKPTIDRSRPFQEREDNLQAQYPPCVQYKSKYGFVCTPIYCCSITVQSAHKQASGSTDSNDNELKIVLYISLITHPQHTNYNKTAGLSVVGRFMVLVLFYMQLRQPTPQRFPPGVIYMVFMSNNEAPQLDRTLYIAPFCPHLLARRKKKRRSVRLYSSFNVFSIATPARGPEGNIHLSIL